MKKIIIIIIAFVFLWCLACERLHAQPTPDKWVSFTAAAPGTANVYQAFTTSSTDLEMYVILGGFYTSTVCPNPTITFSGKTFTEKLTNSPVTSSEFYIYELDSPAQSTAGNITITTTTGPCTIPPMAGIAVAFNTAYTDVINLYYSGIKGTTITVNTYDYAGDNSIILEAFYVPTVSATYGIPANLSAPVYSTPVYASASGLTSTVGFNFIQPNYRGDWTVAAYGGLTTLAEVAIIISGNSPTPTPNYTQTIAPIATAIRSLILTDTPANTPVNTATAINTSTPGTVPTSFYTAVQTAQALAAAAASNTPVPQATANITIPVIVASIQTISAQLSYTPTPATNINWTKKAASASFGARDSFSTVWDGTKISVIGGFCAGCGWKSGYENDVWQSTDGATWTGTTLNAQFSARAREGAVYFNSQLWIFGGLSGGTAKVNDVWYSSNGSAWGCTTTAAAWTIRQWPVSIVYNNKMWIIAGTDDESPYTNLNPSDAWYSSDGANWTAATRNAAFPGRQLAASTVYNNSIWIFGGENISNTTYYNDAWYSSDGANWTAATRNAAYAATDNLFSGIYNGSLFVYDGTTSYVWQSTDGATWTQITGLNSPPTRREAGGFIKSNNFFVLGGYSGAADVNDVWDGTINYTIAAGTVTPANTATPQYTATPAGTLVVNQIATYNASLTPPTPVIPATSTPDTRVPPIQTEEATHDGEIIALESKTLVPTATLVWTATPPPNLTCIVCGAAASPTSTLPGTVTVTPTVTQTITHWPTPSFTMTSTFTSTITATPTFTLTNTFTPTFTLTSMFTKTFTQTITPNVTATATATVTPQTAIAPADLHYSSNDLYYEYITSIYYLPSGTRSPNLTMPVKQLSLSIIVADYFTNTCEVISRTPFLYKYSFETYIQQMVGNNWWIITPTPTPG